MEKILRRSKTPWPLSRFSMTSDNLIRSFVQKTLGCNCPENVFKHITCEDNITLADHIQLAHKIDIGGRLLMYVFAADNGALVMNVLPELVLIGKDERERKGYNRLRLVIATRDPDAISPVAENRFNELDSIDDKIHLHIIHSDELRL